MAEKDSPAEVCLSKRVQEMALNGEEPPQLYICRDGAEEASEEEEEGSKYSSLIPVIDLRLLSSALQTNPPQKQEEEEEEEELEKLRSALSSWGCFQAIGHGISSSTLKETIRVGKEFFKQPMEDKNKISKGVNEFEGYGADPVPEQGQFLDWSDRLFLEVHPQHRKNLKFWPQNVCFKDVLEEYTKEIKNMTEVVSKAMAKALNLEEKSFLEQFGAEAPLQARFNYYSPCRRPEAVLGLKPHADGTGYTVILQDEEGLQVHKDEKYWVTVPLVSDALFVLMGDQMQIMSNGRFKSPVHRVVTNSEKERVSIAMFYTPEPNKEIGPELGLISHDTPQLFRKVKDYADIHWKFYQQGRRALHVARV